MRLFMLAFIFLSGNVLADWSSGYVRDEMRGTQVEVTDTTVSPVNGTGPKLYVAVQKSSKINEQYFIQLKIDSNHPKIDCKEHCEIPLRLDEYTIVESRFLEGDLNFIFPAAPTSLVRAMSMAHYIFIEIPTTDGHKYQYKINMLGFDIEVPASPQINIAGFTIGSDMPTLPKNFTQAELPNCFEGIDVDVGEADLKIPKATVCIIKNKIASISFTPPKRDIKRFNAYLSKQFGGGDSSREKEYKTIYWPKNDSAITNNTVNAFSIADLYYIGDDSLDYFRKKIN